MEAALKIDECSEMVGIEEAVDRITKAKSPFGAKIINRIVDQRNVEALGLSDPAFPPGFEAKVDESWNQRSGILPYVDVAPAPDIGTQVINRMVDRRNLDALGLQDPLVAELTEAPEIRNTWVEGFVAVANDVSRETAILPYYAPKSFDQPIISGTGVTVIPVPIGTLNPVMIPVPTPPQNLPNPEAVVATAHKIGLSDPCLMAPTIEERNAINEKVAEQVAAESHANLAYDLFNAPTPLPPSFVIYDPSDTVKDGKPGLVLDEGAMDETEYDARQKKKAEWNAKRKEKATSLRSPVSEKLGVTLAARDKGIAEETPEVAPVRIPTRGFMTSIQAKLPTLYGNFQPTLQGTLQLDHMPEHIAPGETLALEPGQVVAEVRVDQIRFQNYGPLLNEMNPVTGRSEQYVIPEGFPPRPAGALLYQSAIQVDWSATSTLTTFPTMDFSGFIGERIDNTTVDAMSGALRYHLMANGATIHNVVYNANTGALNLVYTADGIGALGTNTVYPGGYSYSLNDEQKKNIFINATKEAMRSNLVIKIGQNRKTLDLKINPAEQKARDTLRDMLTEAEWRRYVTNGFIMVKGVSGRWYQIFNVAHERIRVYENNKHIHNICIHTVSECPPTDHVINMKVLVEIDEQEVIKGGNVHTLSSWDKPKKSIAVQSGKTLVEIARAAKENPSAMARSGFVNTGYGYSMGSTASYTVDPITITLSA